MRIKQNCQKIPFAHTAKALIHVTLFPSLLLVLVLTHTYIHSPRKLFESDQIRFACTTRSRLQFLLSVSSRNRTQHTQFGL